MKADLFTKVLMAAIFGALLINLAIYLFPAKETSAQVPEVLIAQATDRVGQANLKIAAAIEKLAEADYTSKLKIADAFEKAGASRR